MSLGQVLRTARHMSPGQIARRLWLRGSRVWVHSPLYAHLLRRRPIAAPDVGCFPPAPWPADESHGWRMLEGTIGLIGREHPFAPPFDWQAEGETLLWRFTLHYFEWLADLEAVGTAAAGDLARASVADWMAVHRDPEAVAWHPYPLSLRLYAWLRHGPFLLDGAEPDFVAAWHDSLVRQARHLRNVMERDIGGNHLIKNLKARLAAACCLDDERGMLGPALRELEIEVARQVPADGCHYELSPSYHLQVLCDLMDLAALLGEETPDWLEDAVERMARALAFFRPGDGRLALFNDGDEGDPALIGRVAELLGSLPPPPHDLPEAGYHRLDAGGTVVLVDCARCCPDDLPAHAHADTLSFEMSSGEHRLIVNCGTYGYQEPDWRNVLRGTAAHSTLCLDGRDSAEVYGVFRLGRRPRHVGGSRRDLVIEGRHDGYRHLGVIHRRRLELAPDGGRLDGEDEALGVSGGPPRQAVVHFHLHPDVRAEAHEGMVRLELPDGRRWGFAASVPAELGDSVYAPHFNTMRKSRQIRLRPPWEGTAARVRWSLVRQ